MKGNNGTGNNIERDEYMATLDDKDYRKYNEFLKKINI